jgi:HPt (histidine-containing phosphotransfer) domain-containing protein
VGSEAVRAAAPPSAGDLLRQAFASELVVRVPRLARLDATASVAELDLARRDAHTLASSAWVVGEAEISRLARAVEEQLLNGPLSELVARLSAWTP